MGTRSLTVFKESGENGKEICVMYRQYDGYPSGHGKELAEFLEPFTVVNGLRPDDKRKLANGMGCLAAQVVAHFKTTPGNIYLHPGGTRDCWEEYVYVVTSKEGQNPMIEAFSCQGAHSEETERLFYGDSASMLKWLEAEEAKR